MKLLFDQNLSVKLVGMLGDAFPGSSHVRLLGLERADDLTIWHRAALDGFALVSQDSDFAELSVIRGAPPKVVWLRCGNQRTSLVESLLRRHAVELLALDADHAIDILEVG